ncbi:MAG: hypothetical protein HQL88_10475, partial [Magnetococcales bacterium]|nr:hypothetical protein [Magnetococcales bacterium]
MVALRLWLLLLPALLWGLPGESAEFYRCVSRDEATRFFPVEACQRLADPTTTPQAVEAATPLPIPPPPAPVAPPP